MDLIIYTSNQAKPYKDNELFSALFVLNYLYKKSSSDESARAYWVSWS